MPQFVAVVELHDINQSESYDVLDSAMLKAGFQKTIIADDQTKHTLPKATYFVALTPEWTAAAVRLHVSSAAAQTGLSYSVLVLRYESAAWELSPRSELAPPKNIDDDGQSLLSQIEKTMEKVRPLATEGAKTAGSFAQELIKSCITLNAGSLVAFPTFFRAVLPNTSIPPAYYIACSCFALGTLLATSGMLTAFILLFRSFRKTSSALLLPMLKLQKQLRPDSLDELQRSRLARAEADSLTAEGAALRAVVAFSLICGASILALIVGGSFAAFALSSALNPPA